MTAFARPTAGLSVRIGTLYLIASDAAAALEFYKAAFGAEELDRWIDPENGKVGHAIIRIGGQSFGLADEYPSMDQIGVRSPRSLGGTSMNVWLTVSNLEGALERALAAGAKLLVPIEPFQDGDRRCRIADPSGHVWTLACG